MKAISIALILIGEILTIYAEINAASDKSAIIWPTYVKMTALMAIAGACLIGGYILGCRSFKNIWVVAAISITAILIIEPVIAYIVFKQLPTKGSLIGFLFGAVGMICTML